MRIVMRCLVLALLALAGANTAVAQSYPNRPVRLLVGLPPGGAADIIARLYAQALSVRLGQTVVVENKPGSGGNLASDMAAKATPDGYTLLHGTENVFINNPHIYARMPFDPFKDLIPVASLVSNQVVLTVNPSVPAQTVQEFVELARKTKPPLFYGSIGNGSQHHLAMELFKQHVKIDLTHVPYRGGGPAAIALLAGDISAMFGGGSVVPTIRSGKLRGLASTGTTRNPATPDLPTINEIYPGFEVLSWHGLFVPAGTPKEIVERLRTEIAAVLQQPDFREKLANTGSGEPYAIPVDQFVARMHAEHDKFGKLIRSIGLRLE